MNSLLEELVDTILEPALKEIFLAMRKDYEDDEDLAEHTLKGIRESLLTLLDSSEVFQEYLRGNNNSLKDCTLPVVCSVHKAPVTKINFKLLNNTEYDVMLRKDWKGIKLRRSEYTTNSDAPDAILVDGNLAVIRVMRAVEYEDNIFTDHNTLKVFLVDMQRLISEAMIDVLQRDTNATMH